MASPRRATGADPASAPERSVGHQPGARPARPTARKKPAVTSTAAPVPAPAAPVEDVAPAAPVDVSLLPVRPGEDPWTPDEIAEVRAELHADAERLRREVAESETELADLLRDSGEGAGDDQADAGTKTFEREHELSLTANARDMLVQTEHALERIAAGTYGVCESCGQAIGKARLQAFPRATLDVACKQREERR